MWASRPYFQDPPAPVENPSPPPSVNRLNSLVLELLAREDCERFVGGDIQDATECAMAAVPVHLSVMFVKTLGV